MTIHSTVSLVSYTKASLAQCIGSIIINITAGESALALRQALRPQRPGH